MTLHKILKIILNTITWITDYKDTINCLSLLWKNIDDKDFCSWWQRVIVNTKYNISIKNLIKKTQNTFCFRNNADKKYDTGSWFLTIYIIKHGEQRVQGEQVFKICFKLIVFSPWFKCYFEL